MNAPPRSPARVLVASLVAGATVATTLALAQGGTSPTMPHGGGTPPAGRAGHAASAEMHRHMAAGMRQMQAMQPSGDVDKDFATMMRLHHQQAVDMARVQIEHGQSPEMVALAREIVADQQREIAQIDRWLSLRR